MIHQFHTALEQQVGIRRSWSTWGTPQIFKKQPFLWLALGHGCCSFPHPF